MNSSFILVLLVFISSRLVFCSISDFLPMEVGVSTLADGICSLRVAIYGYPCEEHSVTTADGYILSVQRMPSGVSGQTSGAKVPVLLQHGLMIDGATWMMNAPDESLAFILADNGFDVWIANTRGTIYSQGHTSLSVDDPAYWEWSWDELVTYELPALVQYVNTQTNQKLHYVGHSLGTLMALASFSQDKQVELLRSAALLSPIAYLGNVFSTLARDASEAYIAEGLYNAGFHEFDLNGIPVTKLLKTLCKEKSLNCFDTMTAFTGQNCCLNASNTAVYYETWPQPSATKNMIHISQMIRGGTITMFNYGDNDSNSQHYGQPTPPVYNMTDIPNDFPLFLSYGGADALANTKDVQLLLNDLADHVGDKLVVLYREDYAHADFVMGMNANQVVYDPLIAFFKLQ